MANRKNIHVVPNGDQWSVRREGAQRSSGNYPTQGAAAQAARTTARQEGGELFIHRQNGQIRDRDSYGNDPRGSKGQLQDSGPGAVLLQGRPLFDAHRRRSAQHAHRAERQKVD